MGKNIAIITARGGSKRIPKKNIKEFCGKPIIAYSIEAALGCGIFDEVMVSTDSEEIAQIARQYGASVPFLRSEATSNDFATTTDVLVEVIEGYKKLGKIYDYMCCLYPTAPFVTGNKLSEAYSKLVETDADSLMTVVRYSFPPQRGMRINGEFLEYLYPEYKTARSQDLEPWYHDCGQFYMCRVSAFEEARYIVTKRNVPFIIPEEEVQDIDTESDWKIAEEKFAVLCKRGELHV